MDGVAISIIGRPRPLPGHDTPNPAHNTYTLKCEEPNYVRLWVYHAFQCGHAAGCRAAPSGLRLDWRYHA